MTPRVPLLALLIVPLSLAMNVLAAEHAHQAMPARAAEDHAQDRHANTTHPPADTSGDTLDHAANGHHATHASPPAMELHEGHGGHADQAVDHAAMGHGAQPDATLPRTPIPPITDSDRAAAWMPLHAHAMHGSARQSLVMFNRLEGFDGDHGNGLEWEGQAWVGTDLDKLWLRSEGERSSERFEAGDLEVLYGRAFAPWWEGLIGIRHDFKPGASQDFLAIGVSGLAPYKFEVEATAYLGKSGQTGARFEIEYETLLTNRWILQPLVELNFYGKDDARRGIGSGLSTLEMGLRLRYEVTRQFAPYVGISRERAFGQTADFRRDHGEGNDDTRTVLGMRVWF
jgi:copper resistance protein B